MLRKLLSHAAIYGLAAQLPRVAGVLALPIITPYLTAADYGVAGIVTAYASALGLFQLLGLGVVMSNSFLRYPTRYKWVWRQIHGFLTLWTFLYGLLVLGVLYLIIPPEAGENRLTIALLIGLPNMFFTSTEMQGNIFFQLSQRPWPLAFKTFVVGGVSIGLNIYLIAFLRMGYMGWFYSNFIAMGVGVAISCYYVYAQQELWPIFNFKWKRIKSALRISLPVVPHHFSFFLFDTSDRVVLDLLKVPVQRIGLYNVASSFGAYFMAASNGVQEAASPFYLRYFAAENSMSSALKARQMTFILQIIFLLVTALSGLWMKEVFELLVQNEALQQAYPLAIVIVMGYNFRPMYLVVLNLLTYRELSGNLWKISFVAGIANVVLNIILVPIYGFEVAAFTTFAALMYTGYAGFFLKEYKEVTRVNYYPLLWLLITVLALAGVYQLSNALILYKAVITTAGALAVAVAFLYYRRKLLH